MVNQHGDLILNGARKSKDQNFVSLKLLNILVPWLLAANLQRFAESESDVLSISEWSLKYVSMTASNGNSLECSISCSSSFPRKQRSSKIRSQSASYDGKNGGTVTKFHDPGAGTLLRLSRRSRGERNRVRLWNLTRILQKVIMINLWSGVKIIDNFDRHLTLKLKFEIWFN